MPCVQYCYVHRRPRPEHDTDLDTGDIVIDPAVFPAAGVKSVGVAAGTKDRVHSSQQVRELLDNGPPKPQRVRCSTVRLMAAAEATGRSMWGRDGVSAGGWGGGV